MIRAGAGVIPYVSEPAVTATVAPDGAVVIAGAM
jgi:hypothetical protein